MQSSIAGVLNMSIVTYQSVKLKGTVDSHDINALADSIQCKSE